MAKSTSLKTTRPFSDMKFADLSSQYRIQGMKTFTKCTNGRCIVFTEYRSNGNKSICIGRPPLEGTCLFSTFLSVYLWIIRIRPYWIRKMENGDRQHTAFYHLYVKCRTCAYEIVWVREWGLEYIFERCSRRELLREILQTCYTKTNWTDSYKVILHVTIRLHTIILNIIYFWININPFWMYSQNFENMDRIWIRKRFRIYFISFPVIVFYS